MKVGKQSNHRERHRDGKRTYVKDTQAGGIPQRQSTKTMLNTLLPIQVNLKSQQWLKYKTVGKSNSWEGELTHTHTHTPASYKVWQLLAFK